MSCDEQLLKCLVAVLQVVKLSDTVQSLPRQVTCNVHGVAQCFLDVGRDAAQQAAGETRLCK